MSIWAVTDGAAGNTRQASALAAALAARRGGGWQEVVVAGRYPWRALAPRLLPGAVGGFDPHFVAKLRAERPRLVVGCGRVAALATRLARQLGDGHCQAVQILDPRLRGKHWDVRVVPQHDHHRDECTVLSLGSLHPVDDHWLAMARSEFAGLGEQPEPRLGVLIGGPTAQSRWGMRELDHWIEQWRQWQQRHAGSILLAGSRRTPADIRERLRRSLADVPGQRWFDHHDGRNPYAGMLAWADRMWVSPDSVNLISEAAATAVPLTVPAEPRARRRLAEFHRRLRDLGRLSDLGDSASAINTTPIRELDAVADAVLQRLGGASACG